MRFACLLVALVACAACAGAVACELETRTYRVELTEHCREGTIPCQRVTYVGTSKLDGTSIRLQGEAVVLACADGATPWRHIGYRFGNGPYVYFVGDEGSLIVTRHGKQILSQAGHWTSRCRALDRSASPCPVPPPSP
jgi:hypothetical protein